MRLKADLEVVPDPSQAWSAMRRVAAQGTLRGVATRFQKRGLRCDACGAEIAGEPAGHGLTIRVRGDDVVREELPLCGKCAHAIGMTAMYRFAEEEEEG